MHPRDLIGAACRTDPRLRVAARAAVSIALALTLGACSVLDLVNSLVPGDTHTATRNLEYGPDPRNRLDVYRPSQGSGHPVVVFIHGGSWTSGSPKDYKFMGEALASQGILAVIAGFRQYPQVRYPDFLVDCALAVAWAAREAPLYGGDPGRLYVMGHSSGAYNAAMLALDPRWLSSAGLAPTALAGWIGLAGPYDFLPMQDPESQPVFNHPDYPAGSQPIDYVSKAAPRTFLGAATTDELVDPERNTKQLAELLSSAGVPVTLRIYGRANHYTLIGAFARPLRGLEPVLGDVVEFVQAQAL